MYFALCIKTNPYTFLGNRALDVAPEAGLDSALTIVAAQTLSLPIVARLLVGSMMGRGGPGQAKAGKVVYASNVTAMAVQGHGPFPYQLDGDFLGEVENLELAYQPDMLNLLVPTHSPR